jgi:hypothetical protein
MSDTQTTPIEQGDKVHVRWHGSDNRPPYAAAYTVVGPDGVSAYDGSPMVQVLTSRGTVYRTTLSGLVHAEPDPEGWRPGMRWAKFILRQRSPKAWEEWFAAYQAQTRRLTPTEIEKIKQEGLKTFYDAQDAAKELTAQS